MNESVTKAWSEYRDGINYKNQLGDAGQFTDVDLNERMYAGDQWVGIETNGLNKPVDNIIKQVVDKLTVDISSQTTTVHFTPFNISTINKPIEEGGAQVTDYAAMSEAFAKNTAPQDDVTDDELKMVAQLFNGYHAKTMERLQMSDVDLAGLNDACISGDYINYFYWDADIVTGQNAVGDVNVLTIDTVNVFPGNPNQKEVQKQPYIILSQRENVKDVQAEAKRNGVSEQDIAKITGDSDSMYQSGDRAKNELSSSDKCTTLLKLWKEKVNIPVIDPMDNQPLVDVKSGMIVSRRVTKVFAIKAGKECIIRDKWDTKLPIYPISKMNWRPRKNSFNGQSEVTGLIDNQLTINKILAMEAKYQVELAYPKPIIDTNYVAAWSNAIGEVIEVDNVDGRPLSSMAEYLRPPANSGGGLNLVSYLANTTKENMGANQASLGNANSDNTSAMMLQIQQAAVPIKAIQQRYYRMKEDEARILMQFWIHCYTAERMLPVSDKNGTYYIPFNGSRYENYLFDLKIEVGQSMLWSEALQNQMIDHMVQYLKLPPHIAARFYATDFEGKNELIKLAQEDYERSMQIQQIQAQGQLSPQQIPMNAEQSQPV